MTVEAIKAAIEQLPEAGRRKLATCEELEEEAWDAEMQRDFSPGGPGYHLVEKRNQEIENNNFYPSR